MEYVMIANKVEEGKIEEVGCVLLPPERISLMLDSMTVAPFRDAARYFNSQKIEYTFIVIDCVILRPYEDPTRIEECNISVKMKPLPTIEDKFLEWFLSLMPEYVKKQKEWQG